MNGTVLNKAEGLLKSLSFHFLKFIMVFTLLGILSSGCGSNGGSDESSNDGNGENPKALLTLESVIQYPTQNFRINKIEIGDLNGDGLNDVAAIGDLAGEQHILLFYQGSGRFILTVNIPTANYFLRGLAIGDVNNDGREDLVVSAVSKSDPGGLAGRILIYYQDPAKSSLQSFQELTVSSIETGELCITDINSDSLKDISVLGSPQSNMKGNISIFYQKPDGALDQEFIYKESFVRFAGNIRSADIDNDGRNDLIFQSGDLEFAVVKQLANGTMSMTPDIYTIADSSSPSFANFAVGDADGDGKNDIVLVIPGATGHLYFFLQNSAGKLDAPVSIDLLQNPPDNIELVDINGDGLNDIIGDVMDANLSSNAGRNVRVYYQKADHSFSALNYNYFLLSTFSTSGEDSSSLASGDVTGDGLRDVVVGWSNEGLFVLPGTVGQASSKTTFSISGTIKAGGAPLAGVTVALSGATSKKTTTDSSGNYIFTTLGNGSYTVTPSKTSYVFSPSYRSATVNNANVTSQDFTGTTFSISGTIKAGGAPLAGVTVALSGATSKTTTTNSSGDYTFTTLGNGSYIVTPSKTNYVFSPSYRSATVNNANVTSQDFTGATFSISGSISAGEGPLAGVTVALNGTATKKTTTDASGNYSFTTLGNGSYTVTPAKTGYNFLPENRSLVISGANVTAQDFTGETYTISGTISTGGGPLAGVSVALRGAATKTTTTDANGNYTFTTLGNGSYTLTPAKTGYSFSPANISVVVSGANVTALNFTGTTYTISGTISIGGGPLASVSVALSGAATKKTTTDANGNYAFTTLGNGSYTITPSKANYEFSPSNRSLTINSADVTGQDFTGTTYTISGTITIEGGPLASVSVALSGAATKTTTTNANGNYTFTTLGNGSYTVTPAKTGYSFSPANRSVVVSSTNVTAQDFAGTTYTISGTISTGGGPLAGVAVALNGAATKKTTTDTNGNYTFTTLGNGGYTVTPAKTGYSFSPANRSLAVNAANVTDQNFIAN